MDVLNKKYDIKIEVLTPLSIGAGAEKDWARGVDFVVKKDKMHKLNLKKISQAGIDLSRLSSAFAEKNENAIISLISDNLLTEVSDVTFDWPAESPNDIKTFIKNQLNGNPLLVGSSLKGAVRSILFDYIRSYEQEDKLVFGSSTTGDEFMRFIKFSDTEFNETTLVNTKVFNLHKNQGWEGGWKNRGNTTYNFKSTEFNTIYECIMPGEFSYTSIMLSPKAFGAYKNIGTHKYEKEKQIILDSDITRLFKIINNHTKIYLLKEKAFFKKYNQAENTQDIISSIDYLLSQIPSDNSYCILKMSAGSGFHSITGDWQFKDYSIDSIIPKKSGKGTDKSLGYNIDCKKSKSAKSRKIAIWDKKFDLMGFIKISALSEEESHSLLEQKRKELAKLEIRQKELAKKRRIEQEEQEKQEKEYQKRSNEYKEYCFKVQEAFDNKKWTDVLLFAQNAESIFPNKAQELKELVEEANSYIRLEENLKSIEEAKQIEEEERKLRNSVPLSDKIANVNKLPTLFGNLKQWMRLNERLSLSEKELIMLNKKIVEIYNSFKEKEKANWKNRQGQWKNLTELIGQDLVEKWINEL